MPPNHEFTNLLQNHITDTFTLVIFGVFVIWWQKIYCDFLI